MHIGSRWWLVPVLAALAYPPLESLAGEPVQRAAEPVEGRQEIVCPGEDFQQKFLRPMAQIEANIGLGPGVMPIDCSGQVFDRPGVICGAQACTEFQWCPTNLYYRPLYFDDTPLERYGQTPCPLLQPALSAAHFFTVFPTLPYRMGIDAPCDRVYTLGYYRPGSPTPCLRQRLPFEWDAALLEAGAWVGGVFALP